MKNTKLIKFDFQVSPRKIVFLDAMLYKDEKNDIQKTLYRKPADQQAFLQAKSEHPRSLQSSVPCIQAYRLFALQFALQKQFALQVQNLTRTVLSLNRSIIKQTITMLHTSIKYTNIYEPTNKKNL